MVELGGLVAAAILKIVLDHIVSVIEGRITLQKNLSKDLEKMKMALESVEALLGDAESKSITDRSTCLWLKRLKDAMYAISDMIDEFESCTDAITRPSARKVYMCKLG
jgi:phage-related protein